MQNTAVVHLQPVTGTTSPEFNMLWSGPTDSPRAQVERCARELVLKHAGSLRAAAAFEEPLAPGVPGWGLAWVDGADTVEVTEQVTQTAPTLFSWNVTHECVPRGHVISVALAPTLPPRHKRTGVEPTRSYASATATVSAPASAPARDGPPGQLCALVIAELREALLRRARAKAEKLD